MATLKASPNSSLCATYHKVLDDLDASKDLSFDLIQVVCDLQFRSYLDDRQSTRDIDERHRDDHCLHDRHPATPCHEHKDIPLHKDFTHSQPKDVSDFLSNLLTAPAAVSSLRGFSGPLEESVVYWYSI